MGGRDIPGLNERMVLQGKACGPYRYRRGVMDEYIRQIPNISAPDHPKTENRNGRVWTWGLLTVISFDV